MDIGTQSATAAAKLENEAGSMILSLSEPDSDGEDVVQSNQ